MKHCQFPVTPAYAFTDYQSQFGSTVPPENLCEKPQKESAA